MNEKIEFINGIIQRYDAYSETLSWDKRIEKNDSIEWMMGSMIGGYQDEKLKMMSIINNNYSDVDKKSVVISISKNPDFDDENFELKLLSFVLNFSKYELKAERVYVEILPSYENGINYLENNKYDIYNEKDDLKIYKKELSNKEGV